MGKHKTKAHGLAVRQETKVIARESLLEKIDEYISAGNIDLATKTCEKLLKSNPRDVEVLDLYSELLINLGNYELAMKMISESIKIEPEISASKYLNFAQISGNIELCVAALEKGIEILLKQREIQLKEQNEALLFTLIQIGSAFSQKCELFMNEPLCMREDAEAICEAAMRSAVEFCPSSPEVLAQLASLKYVQSLAKLSQIEANEAQIDAEMKEVVEIIDSLKEMVQKAPEFAYETNLILKIARLCIEPALSLHEKALIFLEKGIEANDFEPEFHWLKALILSQMNRFDEAIESLENYQEICISNEIEIDANFEEILNNLKNNLQI